MNGFAPARTIPVGAGPSVRAVAATGVGGFIAAAGGDPETVLGGAGIATDALSEPLHPLSLAAYCALFERAAQHTGLDSFGLRFGLASGADALGDVGQLALAMPTLDACLAALCRGFPALQEQSTLSLRREGPFAVLQYQIRDGRIVHRRQDAELTLGVLTTLLRRVLGEDWAADEMHFEHVRPADCADRFALLRAPLCFGAAANAIVFRPALLATAMPSPDCAAIPLLGARIAGRAAGAQPDDLVGQVQQAIRSAMPTGQAGLPRIARQLGTTEPSLYRQLRRRGVEFSELTRALRCELALEHVVQPHIAFTEIALLLGYSELSAFSRAFRGWTGVSPAAYRRAQPAHRRAAH